jgi:hypothetical protein
MSDLQSPELFIAETRAWVERAVIGLNLCPFARAPQAKGLVRYAVCEARDAEGLVGSLVEELNRLAEAPASRIETTLLIHPWVMGDFADHNDFIEIAEAAIEALDLTGIIQVASFHPQYQFAGTAPGDVANATNRSPYPTLHLLREDSITRAVDAFPDAEAIYGANIATLERLGSDGWDRLQHQCHEDALAQLAGPRAAPAPEDDGR